MIIKIKDYNYKCRWEKCHSFKNFEDINLAEYKCYTKKIVRNGSYLSNKYMWNDQ